MTDQTQDTLGRSAAKPEKKKRSKSDTFEIVKLLILGVVCFSLGFAIVYLFFRPSASETAKPAVIEPVPPVEENVELAAVAPSPPPVATPSPAESAAAAVASGEVARYAPEGAGPGYDVGASPGSGAAVAPAAPAPALDPAAIGQPVIPPDAPAVDRGALPAAVPPGKTPEGMAVDGEAFYVKCWDASGNETKGASCDRLDLLEKRFATRLYVVDKCRVEKAGADAAGKLSLGLEVDFAALSVSFWNGPSSDLPSADAVARCLKTELRGLPIDGVPHKASKYRMFFTVLFGKAAIKASADKAPPPSASAPATAKPVAGKKGKTVKVLKDKVRVRKTPIDGEEIGKIGAGNEVQFLGRKGDWCEVVTPAGNNGWMICDALGL